MTAATPGRGLIGPNAITQLAAALPARVGREGTESLFARAGLAQHLRAPPQAMVDEEDVRQLHVQLRAQLGAAAADVAREAGRRTADYLLARRIPRPVQAVLKRLPASWAARLLLAAIHRHAWTFVGSGQFTALAGKPVVLTLRDNPLCRGLTSALPACDFYAACFERLFQVLVDANACVAEVACEACGAAACRFEIAW
jgi:divinyl protochlorophyllide a 8-vinyl-reductase